MDLYGQYSKSIPQKIIIITLQTLILIVSYLLLFGNGFELIGIDMESGDLWRRWVIFIFNCAIYLRMNFMILYLLKRKIPMEEAFSVPFAFAIYYLGFSWFVYETSHSFGIFDIIGILIFLIGSYLNTFSEFQRDKWKKDMENKGKLYTQGLFRYSMHINYFGDLLWVCGYAVITHNVYSIGIPLFLFCFFAFYNIPKLDRHLAEKYKNQFTSYRNKTKKFIPFVY